MAQGLFENVHSESTAASPEPQGIGGWLVLMIVLLGISPIAATSRIIRSASEASDKWDILVGALLLGGIAAFKGYVAIALAGKWPRAPRLARVLNYVTGAIALLNLVGRLSEDATSGMVLVRVGEVGLAFIWGAYLLKSRRVKNTYSQESSEVPPLRAAVRVGAVMFVAALVWLGTTEYSAAQRQLDEEYAAITPDEWIKAAQHMDPQYAQRFAEDVVEQARSEIPDSTVTTWVPATITDLPPAVKVTVWYTAEIGDAPGATTIFEAEVRSYFTVYGTARIGSWCAPSIIDCSGMQRLLAEAEEALVTRFNSSQVSGILPDGKCSLASTPRANRVAPIETMTCRYTESESASLSLTRSDLVTASRDLRSRVDPTPEFKRAMVNHVSQLTTARKPA